MSEPKTERNVDYMNYIRDLSYELLDVIVATKQDGASNVHGLFTLILNRKHSYPMEYKEEYLRDALQLLSIGNRWRTSGAGVVDAYYTDAFELGKEIIEKVGYMIECFEKNDFIYTKTKEEDDRIDKLVEGFEDAPSENSTERILIPGSKL